MEDILAHKGVREGWTLNSIHHVCDPEYYGLFDDEWNTHRLFDDSIPILENPCFNDNDINEKSEELDDEA